MPAALEAPLPNSDALEAAVDVAIAACDGDPRAAARALVIANGFLEEELSRARAQISRGFVRAPIGRGRR